MQKILVDNLGSWNIGDLAMLEASVEEFLSLAPTVELHLVDRVPLPTKIWELPRVRRTPNVEVKTRDLNRLAILDNSPLLWRLAAYYRNHLLASLFERLGRQIAPGKLMVDTAAGRVSLERYCEDYDAFYIFGGGNINDVFPAELLRKCALMLCFAAQGKPVILTGQQIGPFQSQAGREVAARALRETAFAGVREPLDSARYCREAGLSEERYAVMGDDSFGLPQASEEDVSRLLARYGVEENKFIALNVRVTSYLPETQRHLQQIAAFVSALLDEFQLPALVVPVVMDGPESDILGGRKLASLIGAGRVRVMDAEGVTPVSARGVLGRAFAALGTSYHFCTFSCAEGVPAVCLYDGSYYSQKALGLAAFWRVERLLLPMGELNDPEAVRRVSGVFRDAALREKLKRRALESLQDWHAAFRQALQAARLPLAAVQVRVIAGEHDRD
ncbi:MAG: polysaccharide pyruvyl transferase family protein [Acidobacteriota bacterium]|nr:polysaccharide pyruvyl transferase family protein [Acidobacteriota bacterium]